MSSRPESDLEKQVNDALRGKRMSKPEKKTGFLPLSRELIELIDSIGGVADDTLAVRATTNVLHALTMADGKFCDRCSNPLGTQVKMVPTEKGPIMELIVACQADGPDSPACDDQNMSFFLAGDASEDEDEDED